jgi:hypothetical protein
LKKYNNIQVIILTTSLQDLVITMKTINSLLQLIGIAGTTLLIGISNVSAAGIGGGAFAYPGAGQSQEQTQKDTIECHNWSVQQTGFDPTRSYAPPPTYSSAPPPSSGSGFGGGGAGRDLAGGAALGAIGGAITGGNVGKSAAIGAAAGGLFGGAKRSSRKAEDQRWQPQQQQQQAQQQQAFQQELNARTDEYRRAYTVCMSSRNYSVQ